MESFILYITKSAVCLTIFLLIYVLFLRPATFFRFNRLFLMFGLVASLIIPSIRFTYDVLIQIPISSLSGLETTDAVSADKVSELPVNMWTILFGIYLIGVLLIAGRNLLAYYKLRQLIKSGEKYDYTKEYKIIENNKVKSPFTVLNYILLNSGGLSNTEKNLILKHEETHISQKHWIDLLCSEFLLVMQWFNPLVWFYVYLLKENHEFLADKAVIDSGISPAIYQAVLINQRFQGPVFSFSNSFSYSKPLNRLSMIKKSKTSSWKKISALIIIPALGVFIWASAKPNYIIQDITELQGNISSGIDDSKTPITIHMFNMNDEENKGNESALVNLDLNVIDLTKEDDADNEKINKPKIEITGVQIINKTNLSDIDPQIIKNIESPNIVRIDESIINKIKGKTAGTNGNISEVRVIGASRMQSSLSNHLIVIDGKKSDQQNLDNLNTNKIESVHVIKDSKATEIFGTDAKDGVVSVTTKDYKPFDRILEKGISKSLSENKPNIRLKNTQIDDANILWIIDGQKTSSKEIENLFPENIESFSVLKDTSAKEIYGGDYDGVIIVKTKHQSAT